MSQRLFTRTDWLPAAVLLFVLLSLMLVDACQAQTLTTVAGTAHREAATRAHTTPTARVANGAGSSASISKGLLPV